MNVSTCFKNPERSKCIDLTLIDASRRFHGSCDIGTRLSHFHKIIATFTKTHYRKKERNITKLLLPF